MTQPSEQEIRAVLALDGAARLRHFVERVANSEQAWGLWNDGWALMTDTSGNSVFPMWPAPEYAMLCRPGDWADYEPAEIPLADLIEQVLPNLESKRFRVGIFPKPTGSGVAIAPGELATALERELENNR